MEWRARAGGGRSSSNDFGCTYVVLRAIALNENRSCVFCCCREEANDLIIRVQYYVIACTVGIIGTYRKLFRRARRATKTERRAHHRAYSNLMTTMWMFLYNVWKVKMSIFFEPTRIFSTSAVRRAPKLWENLSRFVTERFDLCRKILPTK